jgi:hypothetical protein
VGYDLVGFKKASIEHTKLVVIDNLTGLDNAIEKHFDTWVQSALFI